MLHTNFIDRMADFPHINLSWCHLYYNSSNSSCRKQMGSQCNFLCKMDWIQCNDPILHCGCNFSFRVLCAGNWRLTLSITKQSPSRNQLHFLHSCSMDHSHFGTVCRKNLFTAFLNIFKPNLNKFQFFISLTTCNLQLYVIIFKKLQFNTRIFQ